MEEYAYIEEDFLEGGTQATLVIDDLKFFLVRFHFGYVQDQICKSIHCWTKLCGIQSESL